MDLNDLEFGVFGYEHFKPAGRSNSEAGVFPGILSDALSDLPEAGCSKACSGELDRSVIDTIL